MNGQRSTAGFTLIELIVVITLTGIIATLVARNISRPIEGFIDLGKRAQLVDITELALRRMSREIRLALPNSVRLTDGVTQNMQICVATVATSCSVEILRTLDGGRYRARPDGTAGPCGTPGNDKLNFSVSNDCFEVLGALTNLPDVNATADQTSCGNGISDCLVIFNTGQAGANAYAADNIAGIQAAAANTLTFDISGGTTTRFPFKSPRQRFHIVDMPVSFVCNPAAGTITRQADYAITTLQLPNPGPPGRLLADNVTQCTFKYDQGANSRNALLVADITISATDTQGNPNRVRLIEQIQVPNVP
ncbi:MAG: type II secretion system protein J [Gammaproteobacteria bacterium]